MKRFAFMTFVLPAMLAMGSVALAQNADVTAPNNSGINVRDRAANAITAGEQSNAKGDINLTTQIRRAVEKDDSLSMAAHNVKIVSVNGIVTLRGPVKTEQEKESVGAKAKTIAGADKVNNQLEVEAQ